MRVNPCLMIVIFALNCWPNASGDEPQKKRKYEFSFDSGIYCFAVETRAFDPTLVAVTTTFRPATPNKLGSISDEALAVARLLDKLKQDHLKLSFFYIPTTFEVEVRERIKAATSKSNAWRKATQTAAGGLFVQMVGESKAYDELQKVLLSHGLNIASITIEDIWAPPGSKVPIPQTWVTFISVKEATEPMTGEKPQSQRGSLNK